MASTQGKASKNTTAKSKAPAKQTTKAPAKQATKAPAKQATKAPAKQTTKAPAKQTTKAPARRRKAPTHEAIAKRAYELSLAHGDGDHVGHWLQAERELTAPEPRRHQ
jgi:hypothetical protein